MLQDLLRLMRLARVMRTVLHDWIYTALAVPGKSPQVQQSSLGDYPPPLVLGWHEFSPIWHEFWAYFSQLPKLERVGDKVANFVVISTYAKVTVSFT